MFVGHYALALGAKKFAPEVSLGILFLACQLADLIWPNLVLLGIESVQVEPGNTVMTPLNFLHYPYSHSLLALVIWSGIFAAMYMALARTGTRAAIVIAALVLSHWLLDVLTHRPDMPITFSESTRVGVGLWNVPVLGVSIEILLFAIGVCSYIRCTKAKNRKGSIGFWALVAFLATIYMASLLGPPPPSATVVAWSAQALWLLVAWGFWVDHHRLRSDGG